MRASSNIIGNHRDCGEGHCHTFETEYRRLTREWTARRRKGIALALGWIVWGIGCLLLGYTLGGGWL